METLSPARATALARDLNRGKIHEVADVVFPDEFWGSLDRLRDVTFDSVALRLLAKGGRLSRASWVGCSFVNVRADPVSLKNVQIESCRFEWVRVGADQGGLFAGCTIADTSFSHCVFSGVSMDSTNLTRVMFSDLTGDSWRLEKCELADVKASGHVADAQFLDCSFMRSDFSQLVLPSADFVAPRSRDLSLPESSESFRVVRKDLLQAFDTVWDRLSDRAQKKIADDRAWKSNVADEALISARLIADVFEIDRRDAEIVAEALWPLRRATLAES